MWDVGRSDLPHNEGTLTEADWKRTSSTLWILGSFSFVEVKPYSHTDWFSRKLVEVGEGSRYHHYGESPSRGRNAWGRARAQVSGSCSTALSTLKGTHNFNSSLLVVTFKSHTWKHLRLPYNSGLTKDGLIFFFLFRDRALYCPSWPEIPMYYPCLACVYIHI